MGLTVEVEHALGTFDLVLFKVILESLRALVTKLPVTLKPLFIEQNGVIFGTSGTNRINVR